MQRIDDNDLLVIGSGAAGLFAAWRAARAGLRVVLVTEGVLRSGSSYWAQGGIAAVTTPDDDIDSHIADTLAAGRGRCDAERVAILAREGATHVAELIEAGMPFDRDADGQPRRGLEGGHSRHRVLHADGAATGRALSEFLVARLAGYPRLRVIEHGFVHRLIHSVDDSRVVGAQVHCHDAGDMTVAASATLIATGGYAGLFSRSTNPPGATGAGLTLAAAAGARLTGLEFVQFHPTAFYSPDGTTFLLTEALRGAGATLVDAQGTRFLADAPGAELAPRDAVAAAIHQRCAIDGRPWVGLDLRHLDRAMLAAGFGGLLARVAAAGIDIAREPIPVAPAAHYCIGGIATDEDGATGIRGLYAAGEAACTGVHGANRLASNSLLECLVFAARAVSHAAERLGGAIAPPEVGAGMRRCVSRESTARARRAARGALLMRDVGLERDADGLQRAQAELAAGAVGWADDGAAEAEYFDWHDRGSAALAGCIVRAALARTESIGVHVRRDALAATF
ncbi:L-aspartate oxidase [Salinisphaera sp. Q1T1-3]|uniref:L-aspartate oxidase n=1 Tax=Salinisphaera sp. Q1T1-3 TaxID=2321229 RepID=UPI001314DE39|nr:FAD-dependent oxidoreductase [Salinisphaera sp. Q1T1-3]